MASRAHADIGKRDLPPQLRSRFTEVWVDEPGGRAELAAIAASYLGDAVPNPPVDDIVNFYLAAKAEAVRPLLPRMLPRLWLWAAPTCKAAKDNT